MMATANRLGWCDWCEKVVNGVTLNHLHGCPNEAASLVERTARVAIRASGVFSNYAILSGLSLVPESHPVKSLAMKDPLVILALKESALQEEARRCLRIRDDYACPSCDAKADWAGALFLHLLTCPHYMKTVIALLADPLGDSR